MLKYIGNIAKVGLSLHVRPCSAQYWPHARPDDMNHIAGLAFVAGRKQD